MDLQKTNELALYVGEWCTYWAEFNVKSSYSVDFTEGISISSRNTKKHLFPFKANLFFKLSDDRKNLCLKIKYTSEITGPQITNNKVSFDQYKWDEEELTLAFDRVYIFQILSKKFKEFDMKKYV